jgi:hypothetical protein
VGCLIHASNVVCGAERPLPQPRGWRGVGRQCRRRVQGSDTFQPSQPSKCEATEPSIPNIGRSLSLRADEADGHLPVVAVEGPRHNGQAAGGSTCPCVGGARLKRVAASCAPRHVNLVAAGGAWEKRVSKSSDVVSKIVRGCANTNHSAAAREHGCCSLVTLQLGCMAATTPVFQTYCLPTSGPP